MEEGNETCYYRKLMLWNCSFHFSSLSCINCLLPFANNDYNLFTTSFRIKLPSLGAHYYKKSLFLHAFNTVSAIFITFHSSLLRFSLLWVGRKRKQYEEASKTPFADRIRKYCNNRAIIGKSRILFKGN